MNIELIRKGMSSMPIESRNELEKLLANYDEKRLMKFLANTTILANTKSFDPKIIFAAGEHDGTKFYHGDNFKKYLFNPATTVENVDAQNFISHENKRSAYDKEIRAEIGEGVITPDQLWAAWKDLIFKQPKGQDGVLKNNGYGNVWYVKCYDGIVRAVYCCWLAGLSEWSLVCRELEDDDWLGGRQFFVSDDSIKA